MKLRVTSPHLARYISTSVITSLLFFAGLITYNLWGQAQYAQSPIATLIEVIQDKKTVTWKLAHNYDPYRNGTVLRTSPEHPQFLQLSAKGTYLESKGKHEKVGHWYPQLSEQAIRFSCKKVDGKLLDQAQVITYKVEAYTSDKLVLSWQGRHGRVEQVYLPVDQAKRSSWEFPL